MLSCLHSENNSIGGHASCGTRLNVSPIYPLCTISAIRLGLRETFFVSVLVERGLVIEFSLHAPSPETMNLLNSPLAVFSLSLLTLWLAAQIGGLIRRDVHPRPRK